MGIRDKILLKNLFSFFAKGIFVETKWNAKDFQIIHRKLYKNVKNVTREIYRNIIKIFHKTIFYLLPFQTIKHK